MIRYNEEKKANEICLINIFKSINGECYNSGRPTVFIRTFGCNLRCVFCDTKESWTEENFHKCYGEEAQLKWKTEFEIISEVEELEKDWKVKQVCITGGEPLMEENKEFMVSLIRALINKGYMVDVETDGGVDYEFWKKTFPNIKASPLGNRIGLTLITDWKLPHSKMNSKMIEKNLKVLSAFDFIKCVISDDEEDWIEFERICKSGTQAKIYLSPCFGEVTMSRIPEFVMNHPEYDITAQIQAHKIFWDPKTKDV